MEKTTRLRRWELLSRRTYKRYQSTPVPAGQTAWPFVLSDIVGLNHYWLLWYASIIQGSNSGNGLQGGSPSLYLLPAFPTPPFNVQNDPFFLNYIDGAASQNAGPPDGGLRIDDWQQASNNLPWLVASPGLEVPMLVHRPYTLVGPKECLMAYIQNIGNAPGAGSQIELRVCYSQLKLTEDFDL